jgi:hypothetical protein
MCGIFMLLYERATDVVCGKLCQVPVLIDALMFAYFIIHVGKKEIGKFNSYHKPS